MKKTGFCGYMYNFSVDYEAIAIDDMTFFSCNALEYVSMNN